MVSIVQEAIDNNLASIEKMLDARDANREEEQRANSARGGG
jgi:hypothetical protein